MTNTKKWITASQAAELAGVTSETIRNLCKSGALSYKKRNHLFYVNSEDVMQRAEQYAEIHEATISTEQFLKEAQALRDNAHAELKAVKEKTREIRLEHGYSVSNISALSYFAHSVLSVLGEKYAQEFTEREVDIIKNYLATGTVYDPQSMVTRTRAHMLFMRFFRKLVHVKNDLRTKDDTIVKMGENLELLNGIIKKLVTNELFAVTNHIHDMRELGAAINLDSPTEYAFLIAEEFVSTREKYLKEGKL